MTRKHRISAFASLSVASVGLFASGAFSGEAAWSRAVAEWKAGEAWKPGRVELVIEETNADGARERLTEVVTDLSYANPEKPASFVASAKVDGKDVTEEWRKRPQGGGSGPFEDLSPFRAALQPSVVLSRAATRRLGGISYDVVGYSVRGEKLSAAGEAWFAPDGTAFRAVYSYAGLPLGVSSVEATQYFGRPADGALATTELVMRYDATILFQRKIGMVRMKFSRWIKP